MGSSEVSVEKENFVVQIDDVPIQVKENAAGTSPVPLTVEKQNLHTFEELLLNMVKGNQTNDVPKKSRKRVSPGAKLIISDDVRKKLQEAKDNQSQQELSV
ncbi:hypothetical protein FQA39_LY08327 [Lamprigera yunnana]|nr:hypothetical protein FQA39_LY08327 [Lamprigera yunnana]